MSRPPAAPLSLLDGNVRCWSRWPNRVRLRIGWCSGRRSELTTKMIRRGVFRSVDELIAAIEEFLRVHNDDPKPFVWTATAESIPDKVQRGRVALSKQKLKSETSH